MRFRQRRRRGSTRNMQLWSQRSPRRCDRTWRHDTDLRMSKPPAWAPAAMGLLSLVLWEALVRGFDVPSFILPGPVAILEAFAADPVGLLAALASTLAVTFVSLIAA